MSLRRNCASCGSDLAASTQCRHMTSGMAPRSLRRRASSRGALHACRRRHSPCSPSRSYQDFPLGHAREQSRHCFGASPPRRYRAHVFAVGIYQCGHVSEAGCDKLVIIRGDQRAVSAARSDSAPEACGRPLSGEPHARYIANRIDLIAICSRGTSEGLARYANQVEEPLRLRTELDLDHQKLCL